MDTPKIFADFSNTDKLGRVRLNTNGTMADIKNLQIRLEENMQFLLDDHDSLKAIGLIKYSEEEQIWVAEIDWTVL